MSQSCNTTESDTAGVTVAICISSGGVPKHPVDRAELTLEGLVGDGHAHAKHNQPDRAISVQDVELIEQLAAEGYPVGPGIMGENITVRGVNVQSLAVGDRLIFAGGPVIELASVRKPCYVLDAVHPDLKDAVVQRCGFLCRVVTTGELHPDQCVIVERKGCS